MSKDRITSVMLTEDVFEWTVSSGASRGRLRTVNSGCLNLSDREPDPETLEDEAPDASLLSRLKAEGVNLKGRATIGISSDHAMLRVVDLPNADEEEEIRGMVELQVDKFSPFPTETLAISHEVLLREEDKSIVLIAAVQESVVDDIEKTLSPIGIAPARVDATVMGWWRLINDTGHVSSTGWEAIVLLSGTSTELIVASAGIPVSFRVISLSEDAEDEQIVSELANEIDYTLMTLEREYGSIRGCVVSVWHKGDLSDATVSGLENARSCEVRTFSLDELPPVTEGLARRSVGKDSSCIDMTPSAWRSAEASMAFKRRMLGASLGVFFVWVLCIGGLLGGLFVQNRQLDVLRQRKGEWDSAAGRVSEMRERVKLIQRYTNQTYSALECLREVCVAKPSNVDFTLYSYRKNESLKISGTASLVSQVYAFKNKLDQSDLFETTTLVGPRFDSRKRKQVFDVEIRLSGGES